MATPEKQRLQEQKEGHAQWQAWGPYLSERSWGTVREDYSPNGSAWNFLSHDMARSKAYRWGEDEADIKERCEIIDVRYE